ncbi:MAG: hypothetical protein DWQ01_07720 [Planctomycetota bacterium]|nr:MAG: hypothetical protein DWQ01_07720 [Planctomycetota bacterium]
MNRPRLFRNGRLFDGVNFIDHTDLRVDAAGKQIELGTGLPVRPEEEVVDLNQRWLIPGLVDCHVHFREPGLVRKEGYATGSLGALHGGVTTVLEIQNNPPLLTSAKLLQRKLQSLQGVSRVDYGCYGNLIEESLAELPAMAPWTPAVKCFLGCSTGLSGISDEGVIRRLFAAAAAAGLKIVAHCEDDGLMEQAKAQLKGEEARRHDLRRPRIAEVESIRQALRIANEVGASLHVFHLSTAEGAGLVVGAAGRGQAATGTTAPHYLLWDAEQAAKRPENRLKVNPSIKYQEDQQGLASMVAQGSLQGVGTDHAPHPMEEKARVYEKAPSGFPSIDLLLPLTFAVHDRHSIALESCLAAVTRLPADEFGLVDKGRLAPGADADLVILDPTAKRQVEEKALPSKAKWSPYHGLRLRGFPEQVFLRGQRVFADCRALGPPRGRSLFGP